MRLLAVVFALVLGALAFRVDAASACSCAPLDPRSALAGADAAFVGTLVERRDERTGPVFDSAQDVTLVFRVERGVKGSFGETVEVRTAADGASCGLEVEVGGRVGLLLARDGAGWRSSLCWQLDPDRLLAAAQPLPAPNGSGRVALLVGGRFGDARTLALDARGRTLAYGSGAGETILLSTCPGSRRAVELVRAGEQSLLAVRDLVTFRVRRQYRLAISPSVYVDTLRCADSLGRRTLVFFGGGDRPERARIDRFDRGRRSTVWRGAATRAAFVDGAAFVAAGKAGTRLIRVDLGTRRARAVATIPPGARELVASADGRCVAGVVETESPTALPRALLVCADRWTVRTAAVRGGPLGDVEWRGDEVVFFPGGGTGVVRVYDRALRLRSTFGGWPGRPVAVVDGTAWGFTWPGRLVTARLPRGPVRVARELPSPVVHAVEAVSAPVRFAAAAETAEAEGWTNYAPLPDRDGGDAFPIARIVTWVLGLTAFALVVFRLRRRPRRSAPVSGEVRVQR